MTEYQTFEHDVLVIGAGGAGLRAAIEAAANIARVSKMIAMRLVRIGPPDLIHGHG